MYYLFWTAFFIYKDAAYVKAARPGRARRISAALIPEFIA
jgi:hypothetical protein